MKKKISQGNPHKAATPTPQTEVDFLAQLFSLLPKNSLDKLRSSIDKALLDLLATSGKEWVHLTAVFGKHKIDYGDAILFARLLPAWLRFVVLLHAEEVAENYVREYRASIAKDVKAGEWIAKPESSFPPFLKSELREHLAMLSVPAQALKPVFLKGLRLYFKVPKGARILDPDTRKSLHKQPIFVELRNELYAFLTANHVTGYRAARLIHELFLRHRIIKDLKECSARSLHRQLLRHKKP